MKMEFKEQGMRLFKLINWGMEKALLTKRRSLLEIEIK
jgi:hypothetical protein